MLLSGIYYGKTPIVRAYKSGEIIWNKGADHHFDLSILDIQLDTAAYITKAALEQFKLETDTRLFSTANMQAVSLDNALTLVGGCCLIPTSNVSLDDQCRILLTDTIRSDDVNANMDLQLSTMVGIEEDTSMRTETSVDMCGTSRANVESVSIVCSDNNIRCIESENGAAQYQCVIDDDTQIYLVATQNGEIDSVHSLQSYAKEQTSATDVSSADETILLHNESNVVCLFAPKALIDTLIEAPIEASANVSQSISVQPNITNIAIKDSVTIWIPKYIYATCIQRFDCIYVATAAVSEVVPFLATDDSYINVSDDAFTNVSGEYIVRADNMSLFVGGAQYLTRSAENTICADDGLLVSADANMASGQLELVASNELNITPSSEAVLHCTDILETLLQGVITSYYKNHIEEISPYGIAIQEQLHFKEIADVLMHDTSKFQVFSGVHSGQNSIITKFGTRNMNMDSDMMTSAVPKISFEKHPKVVPQVDIRDVEQANLSFWECPIKMNNNLFIRQVYDSEPDEGCSEDGDLKLY